MLTFWKVMCFMLGHKDEFVKRTLGVGIYQCVLCERVRFEALAIAEQRKK